MNVRIIGTHEEIWLAVAKLYASFSVQSVSKLCPMRGSERLFRVYIETASPVSNAAG